MSVINLDMAKEYLDVIHSGDDAKLQRLLDGVEDEAERYINQPLVGISDTGEIPGGAILGVMLLLQAMYQASPDDAVKLRRAAEIKLSPYRVGWGV